MDETNTPDYSHPPDGPNDITPADEVYRLGEEVVIVHGPGSETRVDADDFYDET
ncbi:MULTISPECIES: hypothetical protein [Haloferacaceae]|uniref:Uncharacterized protein n=2 Tax=Haloferacaceae TaxID=1644056 RepID=A0ABD6DAL5_9EURY|nr:MULTISPECIES: hypothetical protein [Halorubraceae]